MKENERNCKKCRRNPTCKVKKTSYKCNPKWEDPRGRKSEEVKE